MLTRFLDFHARARPDAEALVFGDQRLTWFQLQSRVRETAAGLRQEGVGPGSIVALLMKNSAAYVELLYAISHLGAVSLPINFRLSGEEIRYIVEHAGAALLIADEELRAQIDSIAMRSITTDDEAQRDSRGILGGHGTVAVAAPRRGSDMLRLMYTSGTTDRPKGVIHSYDNFYWKNLDHMVALHLTAEDRLCIVGPLYHVGGCDLPGLGAHMAGGAIILLREFDPGLVLRTIAAEKITGLWLAPAMTNAIMALGQDETPDLSTLKWCIGGGERTPESRIRAFASRFENTRYIDAYGMTETVSGDTFMEAGRELEKIGSVGRPVACVEIEIRDDAGEPLPAGREGEICMRGPKVTEGYWKDPERSRAAKFADGFLRSGDIGYLDDEGFLYLTDRKKDMIVSGGENVASSEIERVIYEMEQVQEVAVIARPDERWGEVPVAIVVPRPGCEVTYQQLASHCKEHLAKFKCPKDIVVSEALPRNPSGKVLKRVLRDRYLCDERGRE